MRKRYVYVWFRQLLADWQVIRHPEFQDKPFAFCIPDHGRMLISAVNSLAQSSGITRGMRSADAKAFCHELEILDEKPGRKGKLLQALGEWSIRFSPHVMVDVTYGDGLFMEVSGCPHLWGGEKAYLKAIFAKFKSKGYTVRPAMADTMGAAWAVARYGIRSVWVAPGKEAEALLPLAPEALRLEENTLNKMRKLGFCQIKSFMEMPRSVLRRRFGDVFLEKLAQATGTKEEAFIALKSPVEFEHRLPCMEPIRTRTAIEIAVMQLLENLCRQLKEEGKGLRKCILTCYRIDGKIQEIAIGTNGSSHIASHLFKLFGLKIEQIKPALGIELFVMSATRVEAMEDGQETIWNDKKGFHQENVVRLFDFIGGRIGDGCISRYLPAAHYWPERSFKRAKSLRADTTQQWPSDKPRPTELLPNPEPVEVMALIPDHPPKFFIYQGVRHVVAKADGPERIEREWWMDKGEHRDYYQVEDEKGQRYWIFRSGHYGQQYQWFLHGFFA